MVSISLYAMSADGIEFFCEAYTREDGIETALEIYTTDCPPPPPGSGAVVLCDRETGLPCRDHHPFEAGMRILQRYRAFVSDYRPPSDGSNFVGAVI